jgi:preprotein translocase subunit SecA
MAGRGTDIKLGPGVKEAGGLAIIGTERHESRRVDRQLRGRSGRQGDPGSSQFFVSLEDDLMRLFGSERIASIMDRLGLKEGEVIQHSMITKSIERAQKKVEENNFGTRKRLLEYDDVMNSQREVIYKRRRHALHGERLALDIKNMFEDVSEAMINDHQESRDYQGLRMDLLKVMAMDAPFKEDDLLNKSKSKLTENLFAEAYQRYRNKSAAIAERAFPVIRDVYENNSRYELIAIPITDGNKEMNIVTNLKKAYNDKGREVILSLEKGVTLNIIDNAWKEHLREMDELKQSVQNAVYEQKDPLLIYKFESFDLFSKMVARINRDITSFLMKGNLPGHETQVKEAQAPRKTDMSKLKQERTDLLSQAAPTKEQSKPAPVRVEKKVGRNDPCPCGSGKKYKSCHGLGEA